MLTDQPKSVTILKSPTVALKPSSRKIDWVWYSAAGNEFILSDRRDLWAIEVTPTDCVLKPVLIRTEDEELSWQGTGDATPQIDRVTEATLNALISEGVEGFKFLDLAYYKSKYDASLDKTHNAFMFLSHPSWAGLNDRIEVKHPLFDLSLLFKDRSAQSTGTGSAKKFPTDTYVHLCHPTREAFFTGNCNGQVHLHSCEKGHFGKSQVVANPGRTVNDLAITADGANLFVAAQGKLQWLRRNDKAYSLVSEFAGSPRQIVCVLDSGILVNLGMNGICFIETAKDSMKVKWMKKLPIAIDMAAVDASFNSIVCTPASNGRDIAVLCG